MILLYNMVMVEGKIMYFGALNQRAASEYKLKWQEKHLCMVV